MPTSCAPANVTVTADSYNDSTQRDTGAPLHVTSCSSLPFTAAFHISAVKDAGDDGVRVTTDVTQPSTPAQATSRTVKLVLPVRVLTPNALAALFGGILCSDPTFARCMAIGSASSVSPLYSIPLIGKAYLVGSLTAPGIEIVFPPPFALALEGTIDLPAGSTTFSNVPDVPVTELKVTLNGGRNAAFIASCAPASGTASATLTSQNGDQTSTALAPFSVAGCGSSGGGAPRIGSASLSGLRRGSPSLRFKLSDILKLKSFAIQLPRGLSFVRRRSHKLRGIVVSGAKVESIALVRGRLLITLRRPVAGVLVKIGPQALHETAGLESRARHHRLGRLSLTLKVGDATGASTTATAPVRIR
jgi:hypothetical protein